MSDFSGNAKPRKKRFAIAGIKLESLEIKPGNKEFVTFFFVFIYFFLISEIVTLFIFFKFDVQHREERIEREEG